jgi:DNA-binding NtrC family response regulator
MMKYDWPGNIRELRSAIEHGVVMSNSSRVMLKHLPAYLLNPGGLWVRKAPAAEAPPEAAPQAKSDLDVEEAEHQLILTALQRSGNNRTVAAELLGMSRRTLQRKLKEMNMVRTHRRRMKPDLGGSAV